MKLLSKILMALIWGLGAIILGIFCIIFSGDHGRHLPDRKKDGEMFIG